MRRSIGIAGAALLLLAGLGAVSFAQEESYLDGKVRFGDQLGVARGEVFEGDLYLFGGEVDVDGDVTGDLVVFGGQVRIGGVVGGDVLAGVGTLDVDGTVTGDVRTGAGQVRIRGGVGEDLLAGAGRVDVSGDVDGDLVFGAGQAEVDGDIGGDILGSAGLYDRTGTVGGTENVTIEETVERDRPGPVSRAIRHFGALLIVGLIVMWAARRRFGASITAIDQEASTVVLWGLLFVAGLVLVPLIATVVGVLLTILFAWVGLDLLAGATIAITVAVWLLVALVAFAVIAFLAPISVAAWGAGKALPADTPGYVALATGLAVLVAVLLVPVLGPLVGLAVTILGGGAWLIQLRRRRIETASDAPVVT